MKYSLFLAALATSVPSSWAGKPEYKCKDGAAPDVELGGYNVPIASIGSGVFNQANGLEMVDRLWRKSIEGKFNVTISPAEVFDPSAPGSNVYDDSYFAFDKKNGQYRGVGVKGGDTELSDDEGLYITFGGLKIKEVSFGLRALFVEGNPAFFEKALVNIYKDGNKLNSEFEFSTTGNDADDGQEYFNLMSLEAFDAISFITYDQATMANADENHDYFLEYLDICCQGKCYNKPHVSGDPHIETWSGTKYDFHGVCDLVLLQNSDFQAGLGMDIHIRTKQINKFSYVSAAVLQIGDDALEVMGDVDENVYWINKQSNRNADNGIVGVISGYPISYQKVNSIQHEFTVNVGDQQSIVMTTFKKFVRVTINGATEDSFGGSLGLLGSFGSGNMIARDRDTVLEDPNEFGQEWQVLSSEGMLFHDISGPQRPARCNIPLGSVLRRRLVESSISEEEAAFACAHVSLEEFDMCVFDVMATGDKDVVGAY